MGMGPWEERRQMRSKRRDRHRDIQGMGSNRDKRTQRKRAGKKEKGKRGTRGGRTREREKENWREKRDNERQVVCCLSKTATRSQSCDWLSDASASSPHRNNPPPVTVPPVSNPLPWGTASPPQLSQRQHAKLGSEKSQNLAKTRSGVTEKSNFFNNFQVFPK